MDLTEQAAEELFGDEREQRDIDDVGGHYMGVQRDGRGIVIDTGNDRYYVDEGEQADLLDHVGADTVWGLLAEKDKCVEYLRTHHE